MNDVLQIACGPREELTNNRSVVATMNGHRHLDCFDTDSAFKRQKFREAVVRKFRLEEDAHGFIEEKLLRAAEVADESSGDDRAPVLLSMSEVEAREVSWLVDKRIPLGRITLLVGMPGEGKSFFTIDLASRISTGTPFVDGSPIERGSVVLISCEDDPADTIKPRLDACYADCSRIHLLKGVKQEGDEAETMFSLADVDVLEETLKRLKDVKLVVVDPIGSYMGGRVDNHRDNEVRGVLAPIAKIAERYNVAILIVAHRRKSTATMADDMAMGSRAFVGLARAVWHVCRDPEQKHRRLLLPGKCNLAAAQTGLAFTIGGEPARVQWEREPIDMTADEAVAKENGAKKPGPNPEGQNEAMEFLKSALANGPVLSKDLDADAKDAGIAPRTLSRARVKLGVESFRLGTPGPWWSKLPDTATCNNASNNATPSQRVHLGELGDVGDVQENKDKTVSQVPYEFQDSQDSQDITVRNELGDVGSEATPDDWEVA